MEAVGAVFHMDRKKWFKRVKRGERERESEGLHFSDKDWYGTFAILVWSIWACRSAFTHKWPQNMVWILIRTVKKTEVAENICSCWRSLYPCDSMLAHRVLMAGTVPPQRLPKDTHNSRFSSASPTHLAETSLWQPAQCRDVKCHSFYCDSSLRLWSVEER